MYLDKPLINITIYFRKISPSDVFIIALAATDIMFSLSIHPMLIATSFGANSYAIFTTTGQSYYLSAKITFVITLLTFSFKPNVLMVLVWIKGVEYVIHVLIQLIH